MKYISKTLILAALSLCACTRELIPETQDPQLAPVLEEPDGNIISGSLYVEFSDASLKMVEAGEMDAVVPGVAIKSYRKVFSDNPKFRKRHHEAGLDKWYVVEFDKSTPSTKAATEISAADGVEAVSYPHKIKSHSLEFPFNDPKSYWQWNLSNDGRLNAKLGTTDFKEGCDINVLPVWAEYTAGSSDVIVAVIDEGVFAGYEDLSPVVIPFGEGGSKNFVTGSYEALPGDHGTNVASIIAALNNNRIGISSIAGGYDGNGGVRIMSCAIFDGDDQGGDADALVWAADNGAVISNNSWGYDTETEDEMKELSEAFNSLRSPLRTAIDYFIDYAGYDEEGNQVGPVAGGTVIFAAGNNAWRYDCPSSYDRVIAVAAHGPEYEFASYSSYGPWVDVIAPGGDVDGNYSYSYQYRMILGGSDQNGYLSAMQGTSQAAPHVSGVAALLASYFGAPGFTNEMLRERLIGGARPNMLKGRMTGPMLDAYGAFTFVRKDPAISTLYSGNYTIKSHENFEIEYIISNNEYSRLPVEVEADCPSLVWEASYSSVKINVTGLETDPGQYPVKVVVGKGTDKEVSESFVLTVLENNAPQVVAPLSDIVSSSSVSTLNISGSFSDPDGEQLNIVASSSDEKVAFVEVNGNTVTIHGRVYGIADVTFTASDARGATATQTIKVLVRNTSKAYDVYPNPVTDYVYVRPGATAVSVDIDVIGDFGRKVISRTEKASPFEPVKIDLSSLAPGQYHVIVKDSTGKEFTQDIVKI